MTSPTVSTDIPPVAMTIAGSDPSGGAGLQADLKTFHAHGVYGCSVVTLLTAQNTLGVQGIQFVNADFVRTQWASVANDLPVVAIKTGALGNAEIIDVVAERLKTVSCPLVVDPVMISKHGHAIIDDEAVATLREKLLPLAALITPNQSEAERLLGRTITDESNLKDAARAMLDLGPRGVLIKSHLGDESVDCFADRSGCHLFRSARLETNRTHGSGCVLSAAITAMLAKGVSLTLAIDQARTFVHNAIATAPHLGDGISPLNLLSR